MGDDAAGGLTEEEILAFQTKLANGGPKKKAEMPAWRPLIAAAAERNGTHFTVTSSGNRSDSDSDDE